MASPPARRTGRQIFQIDPSREFEEIYDRMSQLMGASFGEPSGPPLPWTPTADVSETDEEFVVDIELPGARKDDLDIQVVDRELTVTGELKQTEKGRLRRRTRRFGKFEFRLSLPGDVNADMVHADLKDGLLTVIVPKAQAAKPRRIEING
jgi:HSP20 family protein